MFKVKICGVSEVNHINSAVAAGADYVGFVFFEKSKRNISLQKANELAKLVPSNVKKVGLMVNPDNYSIKFALESVAIDILQLHGSESLARVSEIKGKFGIKIMKAIGVSTSDDLKDVIDYARVADELLLDAKPAEGSYLPGGTGKSFDWKILKGFKSSKPWFLAGGLNYKNVREAMSITGAKNLDVSSGVEDSYGNKSERKIYEFIKAVRGD